MVQGPVLVGTNGVVSGHEVPLEYGATIVVGRSRSCDVSLQTIEGWQELDDEQREKDREFRTVSRKHVRISYYNANSIEVEDLSSNGTFVNGRRIRRVVITDLRDRSHELLLGTREQFRLEWRTHD